MLTKETIDILKKNNIWLKRQKGQNYLIDLNILKKIIEHSHLSTNDTVLEIGAGIGTLTIPLSKEAGKVIAIEQDGKIADILEERLKELGILNVDVLRGDATKIDFPPFNKVVSNLPYKISSPITFKLLKYDFEFAILMYQLEFALRMVASPGESNYSRLSLMIHFCAHTEILFNVSKNCFFPKPKISSAVIKMTPKKVEIDDFLIKTSRALFQHKKKTVKNALIDSFHEIADLDKKDAKAIVSKLDNDLLKERVLTLEPEKVINISKNLKKSMEMNNYG